MRATAGQNLFSWTQGAGKAAVWRGVGAVPVVGGDLVGGVGGRGWRGGVLGTDFAVLNGLDFLADGEHGVAEAVELVFGLAFGGLDHEGAGDGEGHGGGVEAEVDEAFGDVVDLEAVIFEETGVDDAFVGDAALGAPCRGRG